MDNKLSEPSDNITDTLNSLRGWKQLAEAAEKRISALLAELEAKAQCITGLERYVKELEATLIAATDEVADLTRERDEARAKLAMPVRLGAGVLMVSAYSANSCDSEWHLCLARDSVVSAILAAGFTFTVEGDA